MSNSPLQYVAEFRTYLHVSAQSLTFGIGSCICESISKQVFAASGAREVRSLWRVTDRQYLQYGTDGTTNTDRGLITYSHQHLLVSAFMIYYEIIDALALWMSKTQHPARSLSTHVKQYNNYTKILSPYSWS